MGASIDVPRTEVLNSLKTDQALLYISNEFGANDDWSNVDSVAKYSLAGDEEEPVLAEGCFVGSVP